jgi:hypothetical protein
VEWLAMFPFLLITLVRVKFVSLFGDPQTECGISMAATSRIGVMEAVNNTNVDKSAMFQFLTPSHLKGSECLDDTTSHSHPHISLIVRELQLNNYTIKLTLFEFFDPFFAKFAVAEYRFDERNHL